MTKHQTTMWKINKKLPVHYINKSGDNIKVINSMGGETDWFTLPHTFGATIGKKLFKQKMQDCKDLKKMVIKNC